MKYKAFSILNVFEDAKALQHTMFWQFLGGGRPGTSSGTFPGNSREISFESAREFPAFSWEITGIFRGNSRKCLSFSSISQPFSHSLALDKDIEGGDQQKKQQLGEGGKASGTCPERPRDDPGTTPRDAPGGTPPGCPRDAPGTPVSARLP